VHVGPAFVADKQFLNPTARPLPLVETPPTSHTRTEPSSRGRCFQATLRLAAPNVVETLLL
jgi:hypothetical protein